MKNEKEQNSGSLGTADLNITDPHMSHRGALSSLRLAANRLAQTRKKPKLKTRDLVGLLLCHSARAWRNSMPYVAVKISVNTPCGSPAVRLSISISRLEA